MALQPALHLLSDASLVDLAALLHTLPLTHTHANAHEDGSPLTATAITTTSEPTADGTGGSPLPKPPAWLDSWMADYAAALSQRCGGLEAADLLQVGAGGGAGVGRRGAQRQERESGGRTCCRCVWASGVAPWRRRTCCRWGRSGR